MNEFHKYNINCSAGEITPSRIKSKLAIFSDRYYVFIEIFANNTHYL